MTSIRSATDLESLDERCRSAYAALSNGNLHTYIALLNSGQVPAYAVVKV